MESVQDRIARRAYDLFVARGGQHGYHIEDWLKAEKETLAENTTPVPKKKKAAVKKAPAKKVAKTVAKSKPASVVKKKAAAKKK